MTVIHNVFSDESTPVTREESARLLEQLYEEVEALRDALGDVEYWVEDANPIAKKYACEVKTRAEEVRSIVTKLFS